MANLILMSLRSLLTGFRNRAAMHAEIIALRQLIVLQRTQKTKRLILGPSDRCLWVWLSRLWLRCESTCINRSLLNEAQGIFPRIFHVKRALAPRPYHDAATRCVMYGFAR